MVIVYISVHCVSFPLFSNCLCSFCVYICFLNVLPPDCHFVFLFRYVMVILYHLRLFETILSLRPFMVYDVRNILAQGPSDFCCLICPRLQLENKNLTYFKVSGILRPININCNIKHRPEGFKKSCPRMILCC